MDHSRESQSDTAPTYEKSDLNYSAATFVFEPHGEMAQIMEQIERFASHDGPVMILGETGTGKEHIAKVIHGLSGVPGPMISINCSAIPADLFENELFGHEKGAYTGAVHSTDGIIGRAENGTIFMDEIGELSLYGQVKILRLIQEKEYEKIGSTRPLKTNARFIFATNRNLEQEIQKGSFRADLYYRISTFEVTLPPLRERKRDIDLLIHHFLWCYSKSLKREIPPGPETSGSSRIPFCARRWRAKTARSKRNISRRRCRWRRIFTPICNR